MPEIDYVVPLDDDGLEWIRVRLATASGHVTTFTVQYETLLDGRRLAVVRYDNAHGFCHRDILDRRGNVIDKRLVLGTPAEVATLGKQDIVANWRHYQAAFLGADA